MQHQKILILDFGGQYTQLIARRVRENQVYCELHPHDVSDRFIREFAPRGIILSGGPASVWEGGTPRAPDVVFTLGIPVLGICYGMQTMAAQLGGKVDMGRVREFGYAEVRARGHSALLRDIQDRVNAEGHGLLDVWMSHGDRVDELPPGFKVIAGNAAAPEILRAANLPQARWCFVAVPNAFEAGQIIEQARALNPGLPIVARAHFDAEVEHLQRLGASVTIMGENEIARAMADHAV